MPEGHDLLSSSHTLNPQPHPIISTPTDEERNMNSNSDRDCSSHEKDQPATFPPVLNYVQAFPIIGGAFPGRNVKHEQGHEQLLQNYSLAVSSSTNAISLRHSDYQHLPSTKPNKPTSSSLSSTTSSQQTMHLAAVPTQELSSRSIISLDPKELGNNSIIHSLSSTSHLHRQNQQFLHLQTTRNNLIDTKTPVPDVDDENTSSQQQLLQQEQSTSNSLAFDATLAAQQQISEWKHIANLNFVKSSPDKIINTSNSVMHTSTGKRNFDTFQSSHKYVEVTGGKSSWSQSTLDSDQTLSQFFENLLESRGYSNKQYCSLETGYHCKPTELQKASYGMKFIEVVRTSNEFLLKKLLDAGLSPNPCNNFGESILHMICRRGDHKLLKIFLDYGCSVQISDDFGRTPLHDACWTSNPCFQTVETLLNKDRWLLHIVDCRGSTPLNYVKKDNWQQWKQFLDRQKDIWWPQRDLSVLDGDGKEEPPDIIKKPPHSVPLPDPVGAPSCEHARAIANGTVEPDKECLQMRPVGRHVKTSVNISPPESVVK